MKHKLLSPRYGIDIGNLYTVEPIDSALEMDALYEICDAEFTSDKGVYAHFQALKNRRKKFDGLFARFLVPKIQESALNNNLNLVCWQYAATIIAEKIAKDWCVQDAAH